MKKFRNYSLLAGAILTFALGSCNNNEFESVPYKGPVAAQVTAGIKGVATRAVDAYWEAGDAIGISCTGATTNYTNMKYVTANGGGAFTHYKDNVEDLASGIFFQGREDVTFSAYYPFAGTEKSAPGTKGVISGNTSEQSNQKTFDYLYASGVKTTFANPTISFTGNNKFKHMMTRLILIIQTSATDGFSAADVESGTYLVSGIKHDGTFDTTTGTAVATGDATDDWEINAKAEDVNYQRTYSMILYPQGSQSSSLTFKVIIDGQPYTKVITPTLVASTSNTYTITVKKSGLSIDTSTIGGWETGKNESVDATF